MGNTCCYSFSASSSGNENLIDLHDLNLIEDVTHLDDLIAYIHQRLNAIDMSEESASVRESVRSVRVKLCIQFGSCLLENVRKQFNTRTCKLCFKYTLSRGTRKVLSNVLKESAKIHWVAIGLSVVAYVLDQIDQISANRTECLQLLRYMFCLAKRIKQLDEQLPQERKKLNDVVQFIVKGCILCLSQMTSTNVSSFFNAFMDAEDLKNFESELAHTYPDLILGSIIALMEERPTYLPPSQGQYPDAVGLNNASDKVTELLDMKDLSPRAVVVYGVGGIGKTTLATAVFNRLNLTGYKHCRVNVLQNCSDSDVKSLQEQILRDLFGRSNLKLRDCVEGQDELSNSFGKEITQPIFMFIDNALRGTDLVKLLPRDLSCLPAKSRLLITSRKFDETALPLHPHIQRHAHSVDYLPNSDAKKLLCKTALGSAQANFEKDVDVDGLVEICGGIPLVLKMVGCSLKKDGSNVPDWHNHLKQTLAEGEGDFSEKVVDCVYNTLPDFSYKEAFLDIASFSFFGVTWKRRWVACIVGEVQLKALEDAALVKISDDGRLEMHDIVAARGKWLSKSDRITNQQGLKDILEDKQRLHQIKGIFFDHVKDDFEAEAEEESLEIDANDIDLMNKSLRILVFSKSLKVKGRSNKSFENLRFIILNENPLFDLKNLKRLAVLVSGANHVCELPRSLQFLFVRSLDLDESIGNLSSLEELIFSTGCISLPISFGQLSSLRRLIFIECKNLVEFPESFGSLGALGKLKLQDVPRLKRLPDSFGQLNSLRFLKLEDCLGLAALPESFGNLSSLESLNLNGCCSLQSLVYSFSQLSNLKVLKMSQCTELTSLPDKFGELKSLKYFNIQDCEGLKRLCNDFGCLKSLVAMRAEGCSQLEGKAMDSLVDVKSMMFLNIRKSPMLIERWEQIKETYHSLLFSLIKHVGEEADTRFDGRREFLQKMFTAMMSDETKWMHVDGVGKLVKWSPPTSFLAPQEKVAILFTMYDLILLPSNDAALQIMREKILELAAQHSQVIYIAGLVEESEERLHQILLSLPEGVLAWTPPHRKASQLFAYSLYSESVREQLPKRNPFVYDGFHSFIVSLTMSMDGEGKPQLQNSILSLCVGSNGNYFDDFRGSFESQFSALERVEKVIRVYYEHASYGPSNKGLIKLFDDLEG